MKRILETGQWLALLGCMIPAAVRAQESITLREAIQLALKQSPDIDAAKAGVDQASAQSSLARTQYLPQVNFTEDISRGDDPVYVFGTRFRQQNFTQADFSLDALNKPEPIGNLATRVSGGWLLFDSFHTQKSVHSADLMRKSADSSAKAVDQKVVFDVIQTFEGVLYAERQVDIARHEQETAEALLNSVDDHVKAGQACPSGLAADHSIKLNLR